MKVNKLEKWKQFKIGDHVKFISMSGFGNIVKESKQGTIISIGELTYPIYGNESVWEQCPIMDIRLSIYGNSYTILCEEQFTDYQTLKKIK